MFTVSFLSLAVILLRSAKSETTNSFQLSPQGQFIIWSILHFFLLHVNGVRFLTEQLYTFHQLQKCLHHRKILRLQPFRDECVERPEFFSQLKELQGCSVAIYKRHEPRKKRRKKTSEMLSF